MHTVIFVFVGLWVLKLGFQLYLDLLNRKSVRAAAGSVPPALEGVMDEATYRRSTDYTLAKIRLGMGETIFDGGLLLILLLPLVDGRAPIAWLWEFAIGVLGTGVWAQALALFGVGLVLSLPGIPWEWYHQFRLEERFGFNKSTVGLWLTDKVKGLVIGLVLGVPLLALILWFVSLTALWWLWAFLTAFLFQLVMVIVYPMFIMPLFNKFEPLPEGDLRQRLMELGDRTGFLARAILVMDGSKRSGHSNAFFTGFGRFRRVVLFDTLVEQLSPQQLEAVLAHEIGHYKLGHIPKMIAVAAASLFASFALIGWLAGSTWFAQAFGFQPVPGQVGPTLLLFGMLSGLVTYWLAPLGNRFSRRHEYEADAFAKRALGGDPAPMVGSLRKLSERNLSNLTPHPLYSAFYYSHPTLLEREGALRGK